MLHLGQKDGLAHSKAPAPIGMRYEVERLGGVLREDDLGCRIRCADETADLGAGLLELTRGLFCDLVHAAVDVGVRRRVVRVHRLEHLVGALGGRGRVEVDEPLPVRSSARLEERELLAERDRVELLH